MSSNSDSFGEFYTNEKEKQIKDEKILLLAYELEHIRMIIHLISNEGVDPKFKLIELDIYNDKYDDFLENQ